LEGSLLHHLRVLQAFDEFKFFHLHFGHTSFMLQALPFFSSHFFVHLLASLELFAVLVLLLFILGLLLLLADHLLDHRCLGEVLVFLVIKLFLCLHFLLLRIIDLILDFFTMCKLVHADLLLLLFLLRTMQHHQLCLFV
jgi:hypothetical protein